MYSLRNITTLYVSNDGRGNGKTADASDTKNGPLQSLRDAFKAVEQMRGGGVIQPVTVKLAPGVYCIDETLHINPQMWGVTVEPYGTGEVIISGGKSVTNVRYGSFNGVTCLEAEIPGVREGGYSFTDLYVDGKRADVTKYPESGYLKMADTDNIGDEYRGNSEWFTLDKKDCEVLSGFHAIEDATVVYNHLWINERTPIESVDCETGKVVTEYRSTLPALPGQEFVLENVAETCRHPNEWYLDRKSGILRYIPENDGQTPESVEIYTPVVTKIFSFDGAPGNPVRDVRFRNITFSHTRGDRGSGRLANGVKRYSSDGQSVASGVGAISLCYSENIGFCGCTFSHLGYHGIEMRGGCHSVKIEGCTLTDLGAGGVIIDGGDASSPEVALTSGNTVSDCKIFACGRRYLSACGILVMHSANNDIIHNEIHDVYYTGISCGWVWGYGKTVCHDNRIMWNHIYDLGKGVLSDMGGVYLLGTQYGTVVSYNRIHDIKCKNYGGWALYTDEGSTGITLESNLCYRTSSNSYHQHYGAANSVRNNIFADSDEPLLCVTKSEAHLSILFTDNILCSSGGMFFDVDQTQNGECPLTDGSVESHGNIFWCRGEEIRYEKNVTFDEARALGLEEGSIVADPLFRNPEEDDYTLLPDSPALKRGFDSFDFTKCGPRE